MVVTSSGRIFRFTGGRTIGGPRGALIAAAGYIVERGGVGGGIARKLV